MKKICTKGYKISSPDRKALEHYMVKTPTKWCEDAVKGMVNKAIKNIMKVWFPVYKAKQSGNISADYAVIIPAIISMPEFKPFNYKTPAIPTPCRKEVANEEIWPSGFDLEDYEEKALRAFYEDPEEMMMYFISNKICRRKEAMIKGEEQKLFKDKTVTNIPSCQDDMINMICAKPGYKNAAELEALSE